MIYYIISTISILVCFIPALIIAKRRLWKERLYVLVSIYWLINGLINLPTLLRIDIDPRADDIITLTSTLIDLPIILCIFYTAAGEFYKQYIKYTFLAFFLFEIVVIFTKGFNYQASTIILGVSLVVIIALAIIGILTYLTKVEHNPVEDFMVFVYSSFLFFYGSFSIVYYFSYVVSDGNDVDNFLLYYFEMFVASILMIYGMTRYAKTYKIAKRIKMDGF